MHPILLAELAMVAAVEDVNHQPQRQPDHKAQPSDQREPEHQSAAQNHGDQREQRHKRHAERALTIGLIAAQEDHAQRNQHEGEQRPDIGEIRSIANIHEPGGNPHGKAGDPGGPVRRLIFRMHRGE